MEKEDIKLMIEDCLKREPKMNEWEHKFIHSIHDQFKRKSYLTPGQEDKLSNIWERVT